MSSAFLSETKEGVLAAAETHGRVFFIRVDPKTGKVSEPIDIGLLNAKVDPTNAAKANKENLRQIKRLALWLDATGLDGRKITQPLAGVNDLRQGDAHVKGGDLMESLALFGIPRDERNYQAICCHIIGQVANGMAAAADAVPRKATISK